MLQQDAPDDYVLATGEFHSVREFIELAFAEVGTALDWVGCGVDEKGLCRKSGKVLVEIDPCYFRPTEVDFLIGDPTKARIQLGWTHKTGFEQLVAEMVNADLTSMARAARMGLAAVLEEERSLVRPIPVRDARGPSRSREKQTRDLAVVAGEGLARAR